MSDVIFTHIKPFHELSCARYVDILTRIHQDRNILSEDKVNESE